MITDATLTQNLDSKARNLEIRKNVLTKVLWEQKQAAEATSPPAKAPVGGTGIPPQQALLSSRHFEKFDFRFLR